jgi:prepilin-type N-terminal cleavage/methylation domain-containing protein
MADEGSRRRRWQSAEQGFTLLELMVTLGIFMFVLLGVGGMQLSTITGGQRSVDATLASNLASSTLEDLRVQAFDTLAASAAPVQYDEYGALMVNGDGSLVTSGGYFAVAWTVTALGGGSAGAKDVRVEVTWSPRLRFGRFQSAGAADPSKVVMASKLAKR